MHIAQAIPSEIETSRAPQNLLNAQPANEQEGESFTTQTAVCAVSSDVNLEMSTQSTALDRSELFPVLVIGAGPAGLAVAACLVSLGISACLVDRSGVCGGSFANIPSETRLLSLSSHLGLPGLPVLRGPRYTTAGDYKDYLASYAEKHRLVPRSCSVQNVERQNDQFVVCFSNMPPARYTAVVVATGIFDHPVIPAIPGLLHGNTVAEVIHSRHFSAQKVLTKRRVLIIGAGVSAIQIAEECAFAGTSVTLASRRRVWTHPRRLLGVDLNNLSYHFSTLLPPMVHRRLCRTVKSLPSVDSGFQRLRRAGHIRTRGSVAEVTNERVVFSDGSTESFDLIILATGYRYQTPFLPLQLERTVAGLPSVVEGESINWPGLYFAGLECGLRLSSGTIRGIAKDAPILAAKVAARVRDREGGKRS